MTNYSHTFAADEARKLVRCLMEINHDHGAGIDLIHTVECSDGRKVTGQLAFSEEDLARSPSCAAKSRPATNIRHRVG